MRPYVLALDLGTTGNRAIVFNQSQKIVVSAYEEFPQIYPKPGWVEHDPEAIWRSVLRVLRRVFEKIDPQKIAAIGVTNQRETILIWDRKTGKPLHHAIVWQCRRTTARCEQLRKKGLESWIHARTGLFLDPYFSGTKLEWLLDHVSGARRAAVAGRVLAGTIDSWIIWKLSGGSAHVTDSSNASRTLLYDIRKKAWSKELCRVFRVPMKCLPTVVPSSGHAAWVDRKLFGAEIPITGIVGDQQGAAFAQGCYRPDVIKNTYGTGLFLLQNIGQTPRFSKHLLTTVAYSLGDLNHTEYAFEGSVFIGGAAIGWLRDGLRIIEHSGQSEALAESLTQNDDVYFVPALVGLGAPYWDPRARGAIVGLTRGARREHIVRAALESIAYQTRDLLELLQKQTRTRFARLRADGGASANNFLMQFQADILGIPVERPSVVETTALGAAGLAGIAVGFWKNRDDFSARRRIEKIFYPKMKKQDAHRLYARWKEAVTRARGWAT